jgi:hypothetical protein
MVYVSLDGEAGPLALGLPELVRLRLVAPWWRDASVRTAEEPRAVADEYRGDLSDLDQRRNRAAQALGLDPAGLPSETTVLARLVELSRGRWPRPVSSWGTRTIHSIPSFRHAWGNLVALDSRIGQGAVPRCSSEH